MRKGVVVVALLFVSLLATAGTTLAVEKNNGEDIVKTLITRIGSLQKETSHLRAVITAAMKKDSIPEEVRVALAIFPEQLDRMNSELQSIEKEVKNGSRWLADDQSQLEQLDDLSRFVANMEDTFQKLRIFVQKISGSYAI